MKKRFIAIAAVMMSMLIGLTALTGCNLVTPNNDRDLQQVVATVQIDDGFEKEEIYKKDMVMGYLNYGYTYVQNYGYTMAQTFELILNNLVSNRLIVQHAMKYFEENSGVVKSDKAKYNVERYLTDTEYWDAKYDTVKSMNDLIDSYEDIETPKQDTLWETVRTTPTGATNKEVDIDKKAYAEKGVRTNKDLNGNVSEDRYKAYTNVLKVLKANGLLGENVIDITNSDYYKDVESSYMENALIEKYEHILTQEVLAETTFATLEAKYEEMYADQENKYQYDSTALAEALSSATADSPIFYNKTSGTYGYVYNLLLGASTEQSSAITKIKEDKPNITPEDYNKARAEILKATTVKDLRSTWIQSGYDFDVNTKKFTGDYAFLTDSLPFQGSVKEITPAKPEKNELAKYSVTGVDKFDIIVNDEDDSFIKLMDSYLGIDFTATTGNATTVANTDVNVYRTVKTNDGVKLANYKEKVNELLFAFSTDSGSLNPYKGYLIEPKPDYDGKDKWVIEFAEAGRDLIGNLKGNSYVMVASDYGYHILFFSEIVGVSGEYKTLKTYLEKEFGITDGSVQLQTIKDNWFDEDSEDKDTYLYTLVNATANLSTKLNKKQNNIINSYKYPTNDKVYVEYNESAYKDLLQE